MTSKNDPVPQSTIKDRAFRYYRNHNYDKAKLLFLQLSPTDPDNGEIAIALARCYANLDQWPAALKIYRQIHDAKSETILKVYKGEACLVLAHYPEAFAFFKQADAKNESLEAKFWLACMHLMVGFIARCREFLDDVTRIKDLWEDDDPKEVLAQKVLSRYELQDFSAIYLDAWEYETEENENPINRWVLLTSPAINLFNAINKPKTLPGAAQKLTQYLGQENFYLQNYQTGIQVLEKLISVFKNDQEGHQFGQFLLEKFQAKAYPDLASLLLGLQIEHLKQFGIVFGLTDAEIEQSEFNNLITKLPYRIAISMQFIFHLSESLPELGIENQILSYENIFDTLLYICFSTFYQDVDYYINLQKEFAFDIEATQ